MTKIKLIASDLDGTLLTSKKEITPRLYQALKKIDEMGIYFVPSTGRPFGSLPRDVKELPFLKYVITSNGASVYDAQENYDIVQNFLTPEAVDITLEIAKERPDIIEFFKDGKAYIAKEVFDDLSPYHLTESHIHYIKTTRIPVEDFFGEIERNKSALENINLVFSDMELRKQTWDFLQSKDHASVTASSPKNIEITSKDATKARALEKLCQVLGIQRENTLAMGDGDNDLPMLRFAGVGVAMANGEEHVKNAADLIADDCNDFGAAKILEQIIEQKGVLE